VRWGMLADAEGAASRGIKWPESGTTAAVVGPAEGLTDDEKTSVLARGFVSINLAASRLRTETAALACACRWAATRAAHE
jgi:RsmE family RNA methyltransferase